MGCLPATRPAIIVNCSVSFTHFPRIFAIPVVAGPEVVCPSHCLLHSCIHIHTYIHIPGPLIRFFFFVFGSLLAVGVVSVVVSLLICALLTSWLRLVLLATSSPCRACRRLAQIVAWPARRVFNQTAHKMASELHRGSSLNTHCKLQVTRTQWRCRSN